MAIDLSTAARVKALLETDTSDHDTLIGQYITLYSNVFEAEMDRWTEETARTEVYRIPLHKRFLPIRGAPITTLTSVKYNSTRDFSSVSALTSNEGFVADLGNGVIEFTTTQLLDPGYVEVQYTGGMGTNTADFITNFPAVAEILDAQIGHHFDRRDHPGGQVEVAAGSRSSKTQYEGELDLLAIVQRVLGIYRRRYI